MPELVMGRMDWSDPDAPADVVCGRASDVPGLLLNGTTHQTTLLQMCSGGEVGGAEDGRTGSGVEVAVVDIGKQRGKSAMR